MAKRGITANETNIFKILVNKRTGRLPREIYLKEITYPTFTSIKYHYTYGAGSVINEEEFGIMEVLMELAPDVAQQP